MGVIEQIPEGSRWKWAEMAQRWGYPRPISLREVEVGHWFTNGAAIAWFISPEGAPIPEGFDPTEVMVVHAIGDPSARKLHPILTHRTAIAIEVIAELLGARKLYSIIPHKTPDVPVEAMRRMLRRYGWKEDQWGSYKLLGED